MDIEALRVAVGQQEIDTAVAAARSVSGVKVVRNDMKLKEAGQQ